MIKLVTDSTSYLDKKMIEELDISVLSLKVEFQGDTYRETDLGNEEFYQMMDKRGIPTSSQPAIGEFMEVFESMVAKGYGVVGVFLSRKMSGTLSTAMMARDMVLKKYPEAQIELMDSESNCMQLGFAVEAGAKAAKAGKDIRQVHQAVEAAKVRSRFLFVPKDLTYLQRGGRIGKANALIGNLLKIVPILTVENGETAIYKKVRQKRKAVEEIMTKLLADHKEFRIKEVIIHHINARQEGEELKNKLMEKLQSPTPIRIQSIGPVIGLHVGPGAIGIVYLTEETQQ